jgi:hypothetical protein
MTSVMMIGVSIFNGWHILIRWTDDEVYHTLEDEWEHFDFHSKEEHIEAIFLTFRLFFNNTSHHDNCCYFMMSSLFNKNIIILGGLTFQLNDGKLSSTPWTDLLNIFINRLILRDVLDMMYCKDLIRLKIQSKGNDFNLFFSEHIVIDISRFQQLASSSHSMV